MPDSDPGPVPLKSSLVSVCFEMEILGELLLGVNTSIIKEKVLVQYVDLQRKNFSLGGGVQHTAETQLRDRISRQNRNQIQKYFSLFIRGPDGFES